MSASYEVTAAILAALKAAPTVSGPTGGRIYGRPPADASLPYVSLGPTTEQDDSVEGIDALEMSIQLDVWSAGTGEAFSDVEVRKIASAIRKALHDTEMDLPTAGAVLLQHRITRIAREADGITNRAIVTMTAIVED